MAFSQGSRTGLSLIEEVTFGVTPDTPTLDPIPFTTHSLNLKKDRVEGSDIRPDRMPRHDRHGNRQVGGNIVADLRADAYDKLLESALFSDFSAAVDPVLKVGTTLKSFTIEDAATDISQYRLFTGCAVSSMEISIAPNQMVTTTFTMLGKNMGISTSPQTLATLTETEPFDAYSGAISLGDNGGTLTPSNVVTSLNLTIDNGLNPTFVIGSDSTPQLEYGRATVTGTMVAYFENADLVDRFLNEVESSLSVDVTDPNGDVTYRFSFPRIKINSADVPVDNPKSRMVTMEFVALYDATDVTNMTITKVNA